MTAFFQLSPGIFGDDPIRLDTGAAHPASVVAVDLDGDGDPDLVSGNEFDPPARGNVSIFFGGW